MIKRIFCVFIVCFCLISSVFADNDVVVNDIDSGDVIINELTDDDVLSGEWVLNDVAIVESVAPSTPANANGFKRIILTLIGNYDPIIVEYRYQNTSTSTYGYLRQVEHDYPWLASCAIFALMLLLAWLFVRTVFSAIMR